MTPGSTAQSSGFRGLRRQLVDALEQRDALDPGNGATLESQRLSPGDPPRIAGAAPLETAAIERRLVEGDEDTGFSAFMDGIQSSRVLLYDSAVPIVHGSVAAVIRQRIARRLSTWGHEGEARIYAPMSFVSRDAARILPTFGIETIDTTPKKGDKSVDADARHPLTLADVAVSAVQAHREALEIRLAESWLASDGGEMLYVDGGISGSARLAASVRVAGVVKSHRTLYGDASAVRTILGLGVGQRTTAFTVASPNGWRAPVTSWYLRLHEPAAHDPLWGLVRIEIAPPTPGEMPALGQRADQISRWVLAEAAPLSLPDSRWDTMVYGIRDCEQFLRSIH